MISSWLWASTGVTHSYSSRPFLCALVKTIHAGGWFWGLVLGLGLRLGSTVHTHVSSVSDLATGMNVSSIPPSPSCPSSAFPHTNIFLFHSQGHLDMFRREVWLIRCSFVERAPLQAIPNGRQVCLPNKQTWTARWWWWWQWWCLQDIVLWNEHFYNSNCKQISNFQWLTSLPAKQTWTAWWWWWCQRKRGNPLYRLPGPSSVEWISKSAIPKDRQVYLPMDWAVVVVMPEKRGKKSTADFQAP